MTQGQPQVNTTNPAQTGPKINIAKQAWDEYLATPHTKASAFDHAVYKLRRLQFANEHYQNNWYDQDAFVASALKTLIRAFGPVRRPSKLANGQRPFQALERLVLSVLNTPECGSYRSQGLSVEDVAGIRALATSVLVKLRRLSDDELLALAVPATPPREKKPYVRG